MSAASTCGPADPDAGGSSDSDPGHESPRWEHFHHGADIGVRGYGPTLAESFAAAALALTAVSVDPARVTPNTPIAVHCEQADRELLLVDWLNAVVFEMAVRHLVFGRFDVTITAALLTATLWGEPLDRDRHEPAVEIKGATCTELAVRECAHGGWIAQCVVDV
jgi:SHS2 domain-containing protein